MQPPLRAGWHEEEIRRMKISRTATILGLLLSLVVLYFYPKDMTPGCTIEAHNFQRDQAQYDKLNAAVVGVSADSIDSHVQFCTKENLTFKLLANPSHEV